MTKIIIALGVLFALAMISELLFGKKQKQKSEYRYGRKKFLITKTETEFFNTLIDVVGDKYYIFPQVHLSTLLDHKIKGQSWKGALSHINQKSVDFVLCDKNDISPKLAIELDGKSHEREDRIKRDEMVEKIFEDSDLPLLRLKSDERFNEEEVLRLINDTLNKQ